MKQPVVVGTDFSEAAGAAYAAARDLARITGARIDLVHVSESEWCDSDSGFARSSRAREWLESSGVPDAELYCREGTPWIELLRHAEAENARFIVVGSHGATGFQPLAPGSTTARLLLRSKIPVLVVPGNV